MAENSVTFDLELATKSFEASIAQATRAVETFGKGIEKSTNDAEKSLDETGKAGKDAGKDVAAGGDKASASWEVFKGVIGAEALIGAFNVLKSAATGLFDTFVVDGVKAALEEDAALSKLTQSLKTTGGFSAAAVEDFRKFADTLEANTLIGSQTTLSNLALAKSYGLTNEQAKQVNTTAADMAKALGIDVTTAVKQLSEAYTGQAGRLSKLNPALGELAKSQLAAGAATEILGAQFAGRGKVDLDSYSGALANAENNFGNLQKAIGFTVTENEGLVGVFNEVNGLFLEAIQLVNDNKDAITALISQGVSVLVSAVRGAIETGKEFSSFLKENTALLQSIAVGVAAAGVAFVAYGVAVNASAIATSVAATATGLFNAVLAASPVGLAVIAVGALAAGIYYMATNWDQAKAAMLGFAAIALQAVAPAVQGILDVLQPLVGIFSEDLAASIEQAQEVLTTTAEDILTQQGELEAQIILKKQQSLNDQKLADDTAHAAKLQGNKTANANELAEEQIATDSRLKIRTKELTDQAAAEKKAEKDRIAADTKSKADKVAAEKKLAADLLAEKKAANAEYEKNEAQSLQNLKDAKDRHAAEDYNRRQTVFGAVVADGQRTKEYEQRNDQEKVAGFKSTLNAISALQSSSSKELFEVGKAAALANAVISTYQAAAQALASVPYPFGFAAAATVTVAGLLNVRNIASQKAPSAGKFAEGGIVGGSSLTGDRLTANVNSREGIFTVAQQKTLFDIANGKSPAVSQDNGEILQRIDGLTSALASQPVILELDGQVVARAVRNQVKGGFALGT